MSVLEKAGWDYKKEYRRDWHPVSLYDYTSAEKYLEKRASEGWQLEKIGNFSWLFRKSEPKDMRFAVTFIDPEVSPDREREDELSDYCMAAGWRKVARWGNSQMQIFATENPQAVPLETDENVRLQNIWEIISQKLLGPFGGSAVLWIALALLNIYDLITHPDMRTPEKWMYVFVLLYLAAVLLGRNAAYVLWHRKSLRQIEEGGDCADMRGIRLFDKVTISLGLVIFAVYVKVADTGTVVLAMLISMAVILTIVSLIDEKIKK